MSKLSELWAEYQSIMHQSANDPYPSGEKQIIPRDWEKERDELKKATPPNLKWRVILLLIGLGLTLCAYIAVSMGVEGTEEIEPVHVLGAALYFNAVPIFSLIGYAKKKSKYNQSMSQLRSLEHRIDEIVKKNRDLKDRIEDRERRQKSRKCKLNKIISDAQKLMGSTEKYVSLLTSENTEEIENEILHQCKFIKECSKCSPDDLALFRSIDPSRDIIVSEYSLTVKPNNEVWNTIEQASRRCWVAQLLYHVSNWHLNKGLELLCRQLMLDTSLVSSTTLSDYLARQNLRLAETDREKQLYQMITSTQWRWKCSANKQLIQQILQNRKLREQMVANVKRRLPAPMPILVPSSERLLKMQGRWDRDNDETAAFLNQMNRELCDLSKSVHAGDAFYALPMIKNATECTIPTGSDIRNIAPHAFEEVPYLTCLSIPQNITNINEYIFSSRATPNIIHIYYQGMQSEWNKISLTNCWAYLPNGGCVIIHCTDTSFVA